MTNTDLADAGVESLVLLGCGKMGTAMLEGWLKRGLSPAQVQVIERIVEKVVHVADRLG